MSANSKKYRRQESEAKKKSEIQNLKSKIQSPILISACLLGINSRYNGTNALNRDIIKQYSNRCLIPVCPEQLGGLPTPRPRAEIHMEQVIDANGRDVTGEFKKGADVVLKIARLLNVKKAVLKEKSPSCGVRLIYNNRRLVGGMGITARLLEEHGVVIEGAD